MGAIPLEAVIVHDPYFDWGDDRYQLPPWPELVLYEMHIGTFNGPLGGARGTYATAVDLILPRQEIEDLRQQDAYKHLSFSVWHALAAHRPLGGINRVRRRAYELSSTWRRQQVSVKLEVPPNSTGGVC